MAAKGKRTKGKINNSTKGVTPITPINTPWWAPSWGGNRADVPVPPSPPNYAAVNLPDIQRPVWMQPGYGSIAANTFPAFQPTTPTTPTTGVVDNTNPEMRYFNPYLQTAPAGGTTGPGGPLPEGYQYPYWLEEREGRPAYEWRNVDGQIKLMPNENAFPGAPVPPEGWTSSYSKDFYSTQAPKQYQWLAGSSNGGTMASVGWRRPGRYYIPDQRVTRAGPGGPITAERPPKPSRRGDNDHAGNNQDLSIPAWVGSLVSWRT